MNTNNKIFKLEIGCLIFCIIFSFINHFLYKWTNNCIILAPFVPINESVWEHGKLFFMPFLFYSIFEYFLFPNKKNFIFAKSLPLVICIPLMITLFYTYTGIIGKNILIVDILISFIIIFIMNIISYNLVFAKKNKLTKLFAYIVIIIFLMLIIFTFFPPKINLFLDPLTLEYGIN